MIFMVQTLLSHGNLKKKSVFTHIKKADEHTWKKQKSGNSGISGTVLLTLCYFSLPWTSPLVLSSWQQLHLAVPTSFSRSHRRFLAVPPGLLYKHSASCIHLCSWHWYSRCLVCLQREESENPQYVCKERAEFLCCPVVQGLKNPMTQLINGSWLAACQIPHRYLQVSVCHLWSKEAWWSLWE